MNCMRSWRFGTEVWVIIAVLENMSNVDIIFS